MKKSEMPDRRRGFERRASKRFSVTIDMDWEGPNGRLPGTVSDISETGCFVLTGSEVKTGDRVMIYLPMGDGIKAQFAGEVINHVFDIGFAVRFDELTQGQENVLRGWLSEGEA